MGSIFNQSSFADFIFAVSLEIILSLDQIRLYPICLSSRTYIIIMFGNSPPLSFFCLFTSCLSAAVHYSISNQSTYSFSSLFLSNCIIISPFIPPVSDVICTLSFVHLCQGQFSKFITLMLTFYLKRHPAGVIELGHDTQPIFNVGLIRFQWEIQL